MSATSVLPFTPLALAWRDITYTVKLSKRAGGGSKQLLMGISGYAMPGRLCALMGASGAGKTTLLDVLGGRKNTGVMTGAVFLNGYPKDGRTFNRSASYCEQTDMHMPLTTVREALEFSAELRLPASVTPAQRSAFIDEIMTLLELTNVAHSKVGNPGAPDGLAPGERKRLTIGVELAANAPILFLDEPTSGLDARAAAVVIRVIRNVASTGRTIICTVHQPSLDVFSQFDDLLLLQRGGWQVFIRNLFFCILSCSLSLPILHFTAGAFASILCFDRDWQYAFFAPFIAFSVPLLAGVLRAGRWSASGNPSGVLACAAGRS
jgi:ABC-type multidrug transport system ATPase subunit